MCDSGNPCARRKGARPQARGQVLGQAGREGGWEAFEGRGGIGIEGRSGGQGEISARGTCGGWVSAALRRGMGAGRTGSWHL
jgi:hypothetical protein